MKNLLFIISTIIILLSCNSDEETTQQTNFYALTVGNSWVYKYSSFNNDTNIFEETGVTDTISIIGTKEIYGDMYFKFKQVTTNSNDNNYNFENFSFLRDYNGNLINERNEIYFSYSNFDEIQTKKTNQTIEFFKLQEDTQEVITDSGAFICVVAKRYRSNLGDNEPYLTTNIYYKDGIGFIKSNRTVTYNGNTDISQRELVSYTTN